ncbi:hypothetical protein ACFWBB_39980 [Streptomyces sp. NPDC060000]|uniref:hypothetical protein n=1 Tax=Streptomyces sp. NPDC060000 TaxID=3347031 RepID=UPI003686AD0F
MRSAGRPMVLITGRAPVLTTGRPTALITGRPPRYDRAVDDTDRRPGGWPP